MHYLLASAAIAYGGALGVGFWLRKGGASALFAESVVVTLAVLSLYVIPPDRVILRAIAAFWATDLMFKVVDYLRQLRRNDRDTGTAGEYLRFLVPFPVFLVVFEHRKLRLPEPARTWEEIRNILGGAAGFATGAVLMYLAGDIAILHSHFALDHVAKLVIIVILVESASRFMHGMERLAGYDTTPPMHQPFKSRTVSEFWSRWNIRVQAWFRYNVFLPVGGQRAPIRGVLLCFFGSGILHELAFGIATSRFDGYQFAFFMLQAPAVLLSRRLERFSQRRGTFGKVTAHFLTISWITVTSILFFHGVDRVFPFYYVSTPWLP